MPIPPLAALRRAALALLTAAAAAPLPAQRTGNPLLDTLPVFAIEMFHCRHGADRRQTGIVVEGVDGLVTALHGVVGCEILAHNDVSQTVWRDLTIRRVDVASDIAVLTSARMLEDIAAKRTRSQRRLPPGAVPAQLLVVGLTRTARSPTVFRLGLDATQKTIRGFIVGGPGLDLLVRRNSPSVDHRVVTLTGPLQPGLSGAPVVDESGHVVAIGDGGSLLGEQIGWSIPIDDMHPADVAAASAELQRLSSGSFDGLFAVEPSQVHYDALGAALRIAAGGGNDQDGVELRLAAPRNFSRARLQGEILFSAQMHRFTQIVPTLPGLEPVATDRHPTDVMAGIGVALYAGALPTGSVDPYLRFAAARNVSGLPGIDAEVVLGGDMRLEHGPPFFLEVGVRKSRLFDTAIAFNKYGDAGSTTVSSRGTGFRAALGIRLTMKQVFAGQNHEP
ncbi:MAG: hypothetical protein JWM41_2028 [Gemmatimonadetes bacterium]|nr:hypothetical protein [Gemmatimonadota bacterium]